MVDAVAEGREEVVERVLLAWPPPRPRPPPRPPVRPSPAPRVADRLRLRPDESRPSPAPTPAFTETDAPSVAERLTSRIVLFDGPATPMPPLTPAPGLMVAVARTHASKMLPPFEHVPVVDVIELEPLIVDEEVASAFVFDDGVEEIVVLLSRPGIPGIPSESDIEIEIETEGRLNDTETEGSETVGEIVTRGVKLVERSGSVDKSDEAPPTTAAGT